MENDNKKCSSEKHKEVKAISYCHDCKVYLCNKCDIFHSELLKNHHSYKIDKDIPEQFSIYCNEKEHSEKLVFFVRIITNYVVHLVYAKLKMNNMVNILIVIFVILKI